MTPDPRSGPAVLMVLGSCVSLQVGAAGAAQLFPAMGSAGVTLLRLLVAALVLLAVTRPHVHLWTRPQWLAVGAFGLCLAGMNGSFYAAIARIPLGTAVTIEFLGPLVLAAVLSRRVRDLGWVLLAATGVVLLGLAADGGGGPGLDRVGVAFALLAGVFWAGYILTSARVGAAVPGQGGLAVALGVGALALVPVGAVGATTVVDRPDLLLLAAVTGLLASVVPYTLELAALRRLPPRVFGVLLSLEPAVAALAGWALLAQPLGGPEAVAVGVVVLASVGSTLSARRPAVDPPAPPTTAGQPAAVGAQDT
ncbi:DMT family transporter [Modestobacter sp. I12A-02662]|uniref:EamA family transporter n=1 Tax=Modestobacter sp. I12A-02662 TaxID=1730496 RepID=UPI0034DFC631